MQKLISTPLLLAIVFIGCQPAQKSDESEIVNKASLTSSNDIEQVKQLIQDAFDEVWSNLDTSKLKVYHTDDFLLLEHGMVWNNDTIANYQVKAVKRMAEEQYVRINELDFIKWEQSANSVWIAYHNYGTWKKGEEITRKAQWLESAVAIKTDEGWKLQMLHSTRVKRE